MNDLISRSELIRYINDNVIGASDWAKEIRQDFIDMVEKQPTAYDVDEIEKQLVKNAVAEDEILYVNGDEFTYFVRLDEVIEILKGGLEK